MELQNLSNFLYSPLLPLFFFTIFLIRKWLFITPKPSKNFPPSPPKLPIIGNLHQLGSSPHRTLQSYAHKHGPIMLFHLGNVPLLVASSVESAREILKTHDLNFSNRPKSWITQEIFHSKDLAFSSYGEYWRQLKSMCVLQLLSQKKVQSFRSVREEEVALLVGKIKDACFTKSVIDLGQMFSLLTNSVICRVAFGKKYNDEEGGKKFKRVFGSLNELLGAFDVGEYIPWLSWVKYVNGMYAKVKRVAKEIDEFLEEVVEEHRERSKNGRKRNDEEREQDFVDVLIESQQVEKGLAIDGDSIKAVTLNLFAAGTDTSTTVLEWAMAEIIRNKDVMVKLKTEVRTVAGGRSSITEDDLNELSYLKAVVKETLRLHAPVPLLVPHESRDDVKLLDYDIAAGTQVAVNVWAIGRDPSVWEDHENFNHERFLNHSVDVKGTHFELLPFGTGRRGCPGIAFALVIVELALANVVLNFDFVLPGGAKVECLDMSEAYGISIHKKHPLYVLPSYSSALNL